MKAGKVADAARALEQIVRLRPDFAEAYFALGVSYTQLGKSEEAVAALRSYLKLEPQSPDGHAVLGILLFDNHRIAEARPELEQAVRLDRSQSEAAKDLGRVYNLEGDAAKAVALLRPLVASGQADDETRAVLARAFMSSGDPAAAAKLLDGILAANPRSPLQTNISAAIAARDAHDLPKALEICERAAKVYPNSEQLENLIVSFPAEALHTRTLQRLLEIKQNPNDVADLIAVGRIMMDTDKGRRASILEMGHELLAHAVELDPGNAAAWYYYGRCLSDQMKPEEAEAALGKALSFVHDDELRVLILGRIGFEETGLKHFDAAEEAFRKSLDLNRKLEHHIPESAYLNYQFLVMRERDVEAHTLLDEILRWDPLFTPALLERAKDYISQQQPGKAADSALLVARITEDPDTLRAAHYLLVKIYRMTGNDEQARIHADWIKTHQQPAGGGQPPSAP